MVVKWLCSTWANKPGKLRINGNWTQRNETKKNVCNITRSHEGSANVMFFPFDTFMYEWVATEAYIPTQTKPEGNICYFVISKHRTRVEEKYKTTNIYTYFALLCTFCQWTAISSDHLKFRKTGNSQRLGHSTNTFIKETFAQGMSVLMRRFCHENVCYVFCTEWFNHYGWIISAPAEWGKSPSFISALTYHLFTCYIVWGNMGYIQS